MIAHTISGSKVSLAALCGFSARADVPAVERVERKDAEAGNEEHAFIAHTMRTGDDTPRSAKHAVWLAEWWALHSDEGWRPEVAFAFDPETGRGMELPSGEHRDYSACPDGWIPLTADAVRVDGRTVHVADWKAGFAAHVERAAGNLQLLAGAIAAASVARCNSARVSIAKIGDSDVWVDEAELDAFDLEEGRATIEAIVRAVPGAAPVAGPHCRGKFCDRFGQCPATENALAEVAPEDVRRLRIVTSAGEIASPEHAAQLYAALRAATAKINAVWQALRFYTEEHGAIDVGGGTMWGPHASSREAIDLSTRAAIEALKVQLGPAWERAVTLDTSKAAIKRAAAVVQATQKAEPEGTRVAPVETIDGITTRTVNALRAAGAVTKKTSTKHEEFKPRAEMPAKAEAAQ